MAWVKYFLIKENWCSGWPDAIVGTDNEKKDKEFVTFCNKHMIDYGYKCDKKIPSFIHNGNSWYCHEKTAKKVERNNPQYPYVAQLSISLQSYVIYEISINLMFCLNSLILESILSTIYKEYGITEILPIKK